MRSYNYGTVPPFSVFDKAFKKSVTGDRYDIRLSASDFKAAENTSIDSGRFTSQELYKGVKELVREWETGENETAGDLASSILYTLGIEWI